MYVRQLPSDRRSEERMVTRKDKGIMGTTKNKHHEGDHRRPKR
jgi:hypothetical protein